MRSPENSSLVSVAPMMEWTDRHCRYFLRLVAPSVGLYTEMVHANAVVKGDRDRLLAHDESEHPVAVQLGGSDPAVLAQAARLAAAAGYDEINLNVGCPSDRVQSGRFGACLMANPALVGDCVAAMAEAVDVPVTVKSRIGIDEHDSYEFLADFVGTVAERGCRHFVVHARIAILSGLSPKENREVPPLRYEVVHRLKREFPALRIVENGGIRTLADCERELRAVDGVMIGREAYHNPFFLADVQRRYFDPAWQPTRAAIVQRLLPYMERELAAGQRLHAMTRHILGLFAGQPGGRRWRRTLSEGATRKGAGVEVVEAALSAVGAATA